MASLRQEDERLKEENEIVNMAAVHSIGDSEKYSGRGLYSLINEIVAL
jgi:hypothetical protein